MLPSIRRVENRCYTAVVKASITLIALALFVVVPFLLWGQDATRWVPSWLNSVSGVAIVVVLAIALLVLDVYLPIPSSLVCAAVCWKAGPLLGGLSVAIGMTFGFFAGYWTGAILLRRSLQRWIGDPEWHVLRQQLSTKSVVWIAWTRPLPVLSEIGAVTAGVMRLPFGKAAGTAACSSLGVAILYGANTALVGRISEPHAALTFASSLVVPGLFWAIHLAVNRYVQRIDPKGAQKR